MEVCRREVWRCEKGGMEVEVCGREVWRWRCVEGRYGGRVCRREVHLIVVSLICICWSFRAVQKVPLILAWAESSMREMG